MLGRPLLVGLLPLPPLPAKDRAPILGLAQEQRSLRDVHPDQAGGRITRRLHQRTICHSQPAAAPARKPSKATHVPKKIHSHSFLSMRSPRSICAPRARARDFRLLFVVPKRHCAPRARGREGTSATPNLELPRIAPSRARARGNGGGTPPVVCCLSPGRRISRGLHGSSGSYAKVLPPPPGGGAPGGGDAITGGRAPACAAAVGGHDSRGTRPLAQRFAGKVSPAGTPAGLS